MRIGFRPRGITREAALDSPGTGRIFATAGMALARHRAAQAGAAGGSNASPRQRARWQVAWHNESRRLSWGPSGNDTRRKREHPAARTIFQASGSAFALRLTAPPRRGLLVREFDPAARCLRDCQQAPVPGAK